MTKRDYFLQKGLQIQRLDEQIFASPTNSSSSREVAKYRDLCPPGTSDSQILTLINQTKGDAQRMENAISELWEDYRGADQDDAWATVSKKSTKKKHEHTQFSSNRLQKTHTSEHQGNNEVPQNGDVQPPRSSERFSTRGRGSMRGRISASSRGGRGGRGRGRGNTIVTSSNTRESRNTDNDDENPENDTHPAGEPGPSDEFIAQQASKAAKDQKKSRGTKTATKTNTTQHSSQVPPVVYPVLTGAWTKKLNVSGVISKPAEQIPKSAPAASTVPGSASEPKTMENTAVSASKVDVPAINSSPEVSVSVSPKKKTQHEKMNKKIRKTITTEVVEVDVTLVENTETVANVERMDNPKVLVTESLEKTTTTDTSVETTSCNIARWGTLDVSTSTIAEWPQSSSAASTDLNTTSSPSAWGRRSPVNSPPASNETSAKPKSPVAEARPNIVPGSPKDFDAPRSSGSVSTSPRPYLKMGKWDSAATPNLSLQFGSFSLNGMETLEPPTSPVGWASTTTATTTSSSTSDGQNVTKTTSIQSSWGTSAKSVSPKTKLSPDRSEPQQVQEGAVAKAASAPPGLAVEPGRVTPTTEQSPRYAPSAPSPASLPKPDDVKRSSPALAQGGPFQTQGATTTQSSKMNIGYGTGLYQPSYSQYSMELGRSASTSTPSQLSAGSGTPKSAGARASAAAQVATQSPSRTQQPTPQMQQIPLQQQQQQQQTQQQSHQKQVQQQQTQQPQQSQQNQTQGQHPAATQLHQQAQTGMQQGYHYAPPPPPGMALPYNPYNYAGYYQGYGYYQNPQFTQYSPRTQYPPRGSIPYGVEGPVPGFSNPPNMPYQGQHMMAQQHEYAGAVPQGFGEINAAYMQQPPMQQQGGHHHHGHQNGPHSHNKGASSGVGGSISQQSHGQRGNAGMQSYQNAGGRDHVSPPVPNASAGMTGSYGQHYGWAGNYSAQPVGGWGQMMPQGYQQSPSQHQVPQQQQQQQSHPNAHQQGYHQYGNSSAQSGSNTNDVNQARWSNS